MATDFTTSDFIQNELSRRELPSVAAVEAARWLNNAGLLKDSNTRPGKPLRDLLRAGRIQGQRQEPNGRWYVDRVSAASGKAELPEGEAVVAPKQEILLRRHRSDGSRAVDDGGDAVVRFAQARAKYKPEDVRYLLVAEAPPKGDSGRFFYFENVNRGDSLFWETMKALYPADCPQTRPPRHRKREFLQRFRDDGFYLLDAVEEPLGRVSSAVKRRRIRESLPRLRNDLREVCQATTKIVLISAPVYDVCGALLKAEGFPVINKEMIDFPGSGCQRKFREKFGRLLRS